MYAIYNFDIFLKTKLSKYQSNIVYCKPNYFILVYLRRKSRMCIFNTLETNSQTENLPIQSFQRNYCQTKCFLIRSKQKDEKMYNKLNINLDIYGKKIRKCTYCIQQLQTIS